MSNVSFGKLSKDLLMGQIEKDIEKGEQIFVTSFTKLSVNGIADLRKNLRQNGAHYRVVKNSLARRVLADKKFSELKEGIDGQCGLGFSEGDVTTVSKILVNFSGDNEGFEVKSLSFDGKIYDSKQVKQFAKLPSRQELLAQVCGALNSPIQGMANVLTGVLRNFVNVLDQIKTQKGK